MVALASITQPPINYLSQGAGAVKQLLVDPIKDVWILNCSGAPGAGEGNGWVGVGSLAIDHLTGKLYQQTGTMAATIWTVFESSGGTILFSSATAITAHSGGGKSSAFALAAQVNRVATVAAQHDSLLLPPSAAGNLVVVTNDGANGADLYGAGTDTINNVATANSTYIPAGQTLVFWSPVAGKWFGVNQAIAANSQAQPANPTAPASTSVFAMQGLAGAITPAKSGNILLIISGDFISNSVTAGDGIKTKLSYGTGTAPVNAAALTGTQVGNTLEYTNDTTVTAADVFVPFSQQAVITGLTLGTAYWLDIAAEAVANISHVGLANVSVTAIEL